MIAESLDANGLVPADPGEYISKITLDFEEPTSAVYDKLQPLDKPLKQVSYVFLAFSIVIPLRGVCDHLKKQLDTSGYGVIITLNKKPLTITQSTDITIPLSVI